MGKVKSAWFALQAMQSEQDLDQPYDDKRPTEPRLNDPYNLWDNDDTDEPLVIDINDTAIPNKLINETKGNM